MTEKEKPAMPAVEIDRRSALTLGAAAAATALVIGADTPARAAAPGGVKLTVLYGHPKSPEDFEKYYAETHLPIAGTIKGIKRIELSKAVSGPGEPKPAFYRIAELYFDSIEQMNSVMSSPEAKKTVADIPNFATGGSTVVVSEIK